MFLRLFAGAMALGIVLSLWFFGPVALPWIAVALVTLAVWLVINRLPARAPWMHAGLPAVVVFAAMVLLAFPAFAATIEVGSAFGIFAPYVDAVLGVGIALLIGWVAYVAKNKLNVSIDDSARDALETFLKNQAQNLVAKGAVKLNGVTIDVNSVALAAAANAAIKFIPDAMARFGLTPEVLAGKIKAAIPAVPSVAQAQAVAIDVANPATPSKPA